MKYPPFHKSITNLILVCLLIFGSLSASAVTFAEPYFAPLFLAAESYLYSSYEVPVGVRTESAPTLDPTVSTDKSDYVPGEIVHIAGSGFAPGESVRLLVVHIDPVKSGAATEYTHSGHTPWYVTADSDGMFSAEWLVEEDSLGHTLLLTADGLTSGAHAETTFTDAPGDNPSIGLEQCHNKDQGTIVDCLDPTGGANYWGNGNAQANNAQLSEGDNQNFRAILEDIPTGAMTLTIELDLTKSGKVAYDRFTSPGKLKTATAPTGVLKADASHTPESLGIFPCSNNGSLTGHCTPPGTISAVPIPTPDPAIILGDGGVPDPVFANDMNTSQLADPASMFIYGPATITGFGAYSFSGSVAGDSSLRLTININKSGAPNQKIVLAWGGHVSKGEDYEDSGHTTATTINGSPYHMRTVAWSLGNIGQQDMQMAASAIVVPRGTITITKSSLGGAGTFGYTADDGIGPIVPDFIPAAFNIVTAGSPNGIGANTYSNVPAGSVRVTEVSSPAPAGAWTLTNIVCSGDQPGGTDSTVNIPGGYADINLDNLETINCTFTNRLNANLTLVKVVENNNGGTAVPADWTLSASGPTPLSGAGGTSGYVAPGAYTLSESAAPTGYTNGASYSCVKNGGAPVLSNSISLVGGDTATCTITNTDNAPSLTLNKVVINDNGGTSLESAWTLTANGGSAGILTGPGAAGGTDVVSGPTFQAGTYALSESGPGGYSASAWSCTGTGQQNGATITLALGQSAVCTITNDDISPTLTLVKTVVNNNGGTLTANDFPRFIDGNAVSWGVAVPVNAGAHTASETPQAGYAASAWGTDCAANGTVTLALAENKTCTITNDDISPTLTVIKLLNPTSDTGKFNLRIDGVTYATDAGHNGTTGAVAVNAGIRTVSEAAGTGTLLSNYNAVIGGDCAANGTVTLALAQNKTCTITNTRRGAATLLKLTNGVQHPTMVWNFTLTGPGVNASDSTPPALMDFGGVTLTPGSTYRICETGIPGGWTVIWKVDTNGDGTPDTIIPFAPAVNNSPVGAGGYSNVFDPNYVPPPGQYTNDTRCVNFIVDPGETLAFEINNTHPGGDPRTIGYWKNWNLCTGGNQSETAANNGGPGAGWYILDDLLNNPGYHLGPALPGGLHLDSDGANALLRLNGQDYIGSDCEAAVSILNKSDVVDNRKKASVPAYNMAAQYLAAVLNLSAGAETCPAIQTAVTSASNLLIQMNFNGTGNYAKNGSQVTQANQLANTLDQYNNGFLCP